MPDVVIVGGGPAGLSAAIYTARAGQDTVVFDKGGATIQRVDRIYNYLGFPDGIGGEELLRRGREQAEGFGAEIVNEEVLGVRQMEGDEEGYVVDTSDGEYETKGLILATGASFTKPGIEGVDEFEGSGVSYCVQCDAFFFRDKSVAIVGAGNFAAKEALLLLDYTDDVTLMTDGKELDVDDELKNRLDEEGIPVVTEDVERVEGEHSLERAMLESGPVEVNGLFVAVGAAGGGDLARMLGIPLEGSYIVVDKELDTGVPHVYAAGDCIGGNRQISTAVGEGAEAAINLLEELRGARYVDY